MVLKLVQFLHDVPCGGVFHLSLSLDESVRIVLKKSNVPPFSPGVELNINIK